MKNNKVFSYIDNDKEEKEIIKAVELDHALDNVKVPPELWKRIKESITELEKNMLH